MPPLDWVFFLDENHQGTQPLLQVLQNAGYGLELHGTHFKPGTPDDEWLPFVGGHGWVLLTTDKRIRYHPSELAQVVESGLRLFCFSSNNQSGVALATALERALPAMQQLLDSTEPPFFATVEKSGRVQLKQFH